MTRRVWPLGLLLGLAGCLDAGERGSLVSGHSPATPAAPVELNQVHHAPATEKAATEVATVGRKLVHDNPSLGLSPVFTTVGAPDPEVFHRGDREVVVTEALARRCQTEGQLAAVLATELAKMASEHRAMAGDGVPDRGPPMSAPVGTDSGGTFGSPDATRLMELAKYEQQRKRRQEVATAPLPAPADLARGYLQKSGYKPDEVDAVAPLLRAAEGNARVEKAMTGR